MASAGSLALRAPTTAARQSGEDRRAGHRRQQFKPDQGGAERDYPDLGRSQFCTRSPGRVQRSCGLGVHNGSADQFCCSSASPRHRRYLAQTCPTTSTACTWGALAAPRRPGRPVLRTDSMHTIILASGSCPDHWVFDFTAYQLIRRLQPACVTRPDQDLHTRLRWSARKTDGSVQQGIKPGLRNRTDGNFRK